MSSRQNGVLTFAERVAYQRAIEEVYWRHRIWPKENSGPKPSLGEVMSPTQIEKKVKDYLRESQLLADRWQWPITPDELQREVDRMATHTKQPDVLRELFEALGNDPFVIAECLSRPILVERMLATGGSRNPLRDAMPNPEAGENSWPPAVVAIARGASDPPNAAYTLLEISAPLGGTDDTWTSTNVPYLPQARSGHTAVWTGSEMIIWGGGATSILTTGARYNPATDSWTAISNTNVPPARSNCTAVWSGTEMIIWGGYDGNLDLNSGGRYNPEQRQLGRNQ